MSRGSTPHELTRRGASARSFRSMFVCQCQTSHVKSAFFCLSHVGLRIQERVTLVDLFILPKAKVPQEVHAAGTNLPRKLPRLLLEKNARNTNPLLLAYLCLLIPRSTESGHECVAPKEVLQGSRTTTELTHGDVFSGGPIE